MPKWQQCICMCVNVFVWKPFGFVSFLMVVMNGHPIQFKTTGTTLLRAKVSTDWRFCMRLYSIALNSLSLRLCVCLCVSACMHCTGTDKDRIQCHDTKHKWNWFYTFFLLSRFHLFYFLFYFYSYEQWGERKKKKWIGLNEHHFTNITFEQTVTYYL